MTQIPFRDRAAVEAALSTAPLTRRREVPESESGVTFTDDVKMAVSANNPFGWIARAYGESGFTPDPEFKGVFADQDLADYLTEGLDPKYWNQLGRAVSADHAHRISDDFRELGVMRKQLDDDGWAGTGANFVASLLDPTNYALGAATGAIGWVRTGSRLAQLAKAGLVNAGAAVVTDAGMATVDPEITAERVGVNALAAFGIGAGLHAIAGAAQTAALSAKAQRWKTLMESEPAMGAAGRFEFTPEMRAKLFDQQMTEQGRLVFNGEVSPEARAKLRDDIIDTLGLDPTDADDLETIFSLKQQEPEDFINNYAGKFHELVDMNYRSDDAGIAGDAAGSPVPPKDLQPWQIPRDEFAANRPKPDGVVPDPTVDRMAQDLQSPSGNPGYSIEPGYDNSIAQTGEIPGFRNVVFRDAEGNPAGILRVVYDQDGNAIENLSVAVRPDMQRQGVGQGLYRFAAQNGMDVEAASGIGGFTEAGARLKHRREVTKAAMEGKPVPQSVLDDYPDIAPPKPPSPPKIAGDFQPTNMSTFTAPYWRFDLGGRLGKATSKSVRFISSMLTDDGVLRSQDGKLTARVDSATVWHGRNIAMHMAAYFREKNRLFDEFVSEQRVPWHGKGKARRTFNTAVSEAIRDPDAFAAATPQVKAMATYAKKGMSVIRDQGNRHGLQIADAGENYLPRIWDRVMVNDAVKRYGEDFVAVEMIGKAFQKSTGADDAVSERVGRGMLKTIQNPERLDEMAMARLLGGDPVAVEAILRDFIPDADNDTIANLVNGLAREPKKGSTARAKTRTTLDETHVADAPDGSTVALNSLFNNDIDALFSSYSRSITGAAAERTVLDNAGQYFGAEFKNWQQLEAALVRDGATPTDIARMDIVRRYLRGQAMPLDIKNERVAAVLRTIRAMGYAANGGGFTFAQIPELGKLLGQSGVKNFLKSVPMFKMFREGGDMASRDIAELAERFGIAVPDRLTHRLHEMSPIYESTGELQAAKVEGAVEKFNRVQSAATGLNAINDLSHRMAAEAGWFKLHDLVGQADSVREERLLSLGLTREDATRVGAILADDANYSTSQRGTRVLDPTLVKDQQGLNLFIGAWHQFVRTSIQKNDLGNLAGWMHSNWAKMLLQFRSFSMGAYSLQTLAAIQRMNDPEVWAGLMASTALSAMAYYARTELASAGRADREDYLDRMLAPKVVIPAIAGNVGVSSIIPPVFDAASTFSGGPAVFSASRYSGLGSSASGVEDILEQVPGVNLINNAKKAYQTISLPALAQRKTFTAAKFRAWRSLVWGQRAPGIRNVLDAIETRMPQREDD